MSSANSDYVKQYFDTVAEEFGESYHYERWMKNALRRRDYEHTLKAILFHLRGRLFGKVLEIGCGVGTWTVEFSKVCGELTILDISSKMAQETTNKLHKTGFYSVEQVLGDFQNQNLKVGGPYDAIFSVRAIEYMQDKVFVLHRIHHLLKKGGFALIITKNPDTSLIPFAFLATGRIFKPPKIFSNLIHYKKLLTIAKAAGFDDFSAYPVITSFRFPLSGSYLKILSDRFHEFSYKRQINPAYLTLLESYAVVLKT